MSWPKTFINAAVLTFAKRLSTAPSYRQKKGLAVGKTKRGKGTKIMAVADASGLPVAAHVESASPHELSWLKPPLKAALSFKLPSA